MYYGNKQKALDKFFPVPNVIFNLGLEGGEILVYLYLMYCEDRKTFQCYPGYKTIGSAVGMSVNTVRKYVQSLEKKRLITTEWTMVRTKSGKAHNGTLKYTIRPIQEAIDYYEEIQMKRLYAEAARRRAEEALAKYDEKHRNRAV
jgi:hypothetical protein